MSVPFFKCSTPAGSDLCFFGGVCVNSTLPGQEQCECPPGYTHDFLLFHNRNCALPSNFYFVFLLWTTVLSGISLVLTIVTVFKKQGHWRRVALMHCVQIVCAWSCVLSIYLQDGFFEAASVTAGMSLILATYQLYHLFSTTLLHPLFQADVNLDENDKNRIRLAFRAIPIISMIRLFLVHLAMLALCRAEDPRAFNLVFIINAFLAPLFAIINILLIRPHRKKMIEVLNKAIEGLQTSSESAHMVLVLTNYKRRLQRITKQFNSALILYMYFFIPYGIVYLILGSAPFLWVFQAVSLQVTYMWTIHLFRSAGTMESIKNSSRTQDSSQITAVMTKAT